MESGAGHFMVATKIATLSRAMGETNEVLGRFSNTWYFGVLGQRACCIWAALNRWR